MGIVIKKKANQAVKTELAKLIEQTPTKPKKKDKDREMVDAINGKEAADAAAKGNILAWAVAKFGPEMIYADGERTKKQAKRFARELWEKEQSATKAEAKKQKNEAMAALVTGAEKRKAVKDAAKDKQLKDEIQQQHTKLKLSLDKQLMDATTAYVNGPVKEVLDSFVALYVSRKTDGDSVEAARALDACRTAFDGCGLLLVDVNTKAKDSKPVSKPAKPTKKQKKGKK